MNSSTGKFLGELEKEKLEEELEKIKKQRDKFKGMIFKPNIQQSTKNLETSKKKKVGGQIGHRGNSRMLPPKVDQINIVTVIIDGLNNKEREVVRIELKKLKIKYNKIRGMKDEQSTFLRLSDAMAGFLREVFEKEEYTLKFIKRFKERRMVLEA